MPAIAKRHPYSYTLQLMRLALERLPSLFPVERQSYYKDKLVALEADPAVDYELVRSIVADFGKESWPFRCAYEDFYEQYGRVSEEANMLNHLDRGLRQKYEKFLHDGGKLNYLMTAHVEADLRQPTPFERYFSPDEKYALEQSMLGARQSAREEIDGLIAGKKRAEFQTVVQEHLARQARMLGMLEELRNLANVEQKFAVDIKEAVRSFEEGWSLAERQPDEQRLVQELENWRGKLSSFLS